MRSLIYRLALGGFAAGILLGIFLPVWVSLLLCAIAVGLFFLCSCHRF